VLTKEKPKKKYQDITNKIALHNAEQSMLFYKVINKITRDKCEIEKIFYSKVNAQQYADYLNYVFNENNVYIVDPFIYTMSREEKEMYSKIIKVRRSYSKNN